MRGCPLLYGVQKGPRAPCLFYQSHAMFGVCFHISSLCHRSPTGTAGAPTPGRGAAHLGEVAGALAVCTLCFGESSLLGMNYSTRDGVCSTQRQRGRRVAIDSASRDVQNPDRAVARAGLVLGTRWIAFVCEPIDLASRTDRVDLPLAVCTQRTKDELRLFEPVSTCFHGV